MSYHKIVKDLVKGCFTLGEVTDFRVQEAAGWEEEQFIRVTIVLNDDTENFDTRKAAVFRRELRNKLDEINHDAFPIVSFRSAEDDKDAQAA